MQLLKHSLSICFPSTALLLMMIVITRKCSCIKLTPNLTAADSDRNQNISSLLDALMEGYDHHLRPDFGGPPTEVYIDIVVRSMGPVSEIDMTYSMDCYFRQSWVDRRLEFTGSMSTLALSISMLEKLWKPDTYFYNGKFSYLHTITTPNKFVRIYQNGRVLYSSRLTIKASCPMNLENFPMDIQRCPLEVGSYSYSSRDVRYNWNPARRVVTAPDMKMSMFDLIATPSGNQTDNFRKDGPYSVLIVSFHFKRHMGYFVIEVYAPCMMLVVLSWVSFWINREATADRVALGVTTVLTMTFLGLESRNDLPKVPYCTALDYFVAISFAFIFSTIVEFAVVHFFTKVGSGEYYFSPMFLTGENSSSEDEEGEDDANQHVIQETGDDETEKEDEVRITADKVAEAVPQSSVYSTASESRQLRRSSSTASGSFRCVEARNGGVLSRSGSAVMFRRRRQSKRESIMAAKKGGKESNMKSIVFQMNSVSKIDKVSRVVFPVVFVIINFIYWYTYLGSES